MKAAAKAAVKAYVIVQEKITDQAMFDTYKAQVLPTLEPFGGHFLVRGGAYTVMEGDWALERVAVLEFPSREAAEGWYNSPAYQEILPLRANAGLSNFIIIDGVA